MLFNLRHLKFCILFFKNFLFNLRHIKFCILFKKNYFIQDILSFVFYF